jgi:hypothetical protein
MNLTAEGITALAPDAASAVAGKKLATARAWQGLGRNAEALWGECQGSALYQVRADLADLTVKCSCPSRKFPCKHGLGLMLLAATAPEAVPPAVPPDWVTEWLARRAAEAGKREARRAEKATAEADPAAQARRADRRLARVAEGLDALDLWMNDLVRHGLASLEAQPATVWERQAARLVDAQAPGVAGRVRRMAAIPNSGPGWPDRLLGQLGRLALLTHAFRRSDGLDPALQEDVRAAIGWTLDRDEVAARGEKVNDDWAVVGQRSGDDERLRTQWTWLLGLHTRRRALVLQFSAGGGPSAERFPEALVPGTHQEADLIYWPSASVQRALIAGRRGAPVALEGRLPGMPSVHRFLRDVAETMARQPWLEQFPCVLADVVPVHDGAGWWVRDTSGAALPLAGDEHWRLLALSGGTPVDLAGEWNGERLLPLGMMVDGSYYWLAAGG